MTSSPDFDVGCTSVFVVKPHVFLTASLASSNATATSDQPGGASIPPASPLSSADVAASDQPGDATNSAAAVVDGPSVQAPLAVPFPNSPPLITSQPARATTPAQPSQPASSTAPEVDASSVAASPSLSPLSQSQGRPLSSSERLSASRNTPPIAAITVPLSVAAAILLGAGLMAIRHSRKLASEQVKGEASIRSDDAVRLLDEISRRSTILGAAPSPPDHKPNANVPPAGGFDLEKALLINALLADRHRIPVLPSVYDHHPYTVPPVDVRRQLRQRTKDAYAFSQPITPSSASRPYTADLIPSRPSPVSATYKPSKPTLPPLQTQQSTRTASTEAADEPVTEDFLPFYLPSPDTASNPPPARASPTFEEIPLSPRLPPALHIRAPAPAELDKAASGEMVAGACHYGAPPTSSSSEHHILFEAVARALGAR
jgi:hypothetical protein